MIFWSGCVVNGFVYKLPSLLPVVPVTSTYSSKAALNSGCVSKLESGIQGSDSVFDSSVSVSSGAVAVSYTHLYSSVTSLNSCFPRAKAMSPSMLVALGSTSSGFTSG